MQSQAQLSLVRIVVLFAVSAFLITSVALPAAAQNPVPPTAVQAAKSPQFASRLAHPGTRPASQPKPPLARRAPHRGPGGPGNDIYDNGPTNGNTDSWTINFGYIVSDTFTITDQPTGEITGMSFSAWLFPDDFLTSVEVSLTSQPNGGISYFDQTVNFMQQGSCTPNWFGFNICNETSSYFNGPTLNPGTYWVNLQNASVLSGGPIYWDENSGEGCDSQGCPSQAEENSVGSIPSESFTILGENCFNPAQEKPAAAAKVVTVPPSPTQTYRVIYNFTGGADGASPSATLAIDAAGNLYGTTAGGGPAGDGTVFKLTPRSSGWIFTRLFAFTGANGAAPDSPLLLTSDGIVGTTQFGGVGNGVLFGLSPGASVLPSVFSNWLENLLYSFTGGNDGANPGGSLVLDTAGNVYGSAAMGGANHGGTLYEFTNGGIQVLHAFHSSFDDGVGPLDVVNGSSGLYGITGAGGAERLGTLYTTAGGYQVLHSFMSIAPEGSPTSLTVDPMGNLYGAASYSYIDCLQTRVYGTSIYQLSPPGWSPAILFHSENTNTPLTSWVSTDALGNVYGTTNSDGSQGLGAAFQLTCCWNYTDLHDFAGSPNDGANPAASPVVDAQGNIYGTTQNGGAYGYGVVWEISP